MNLTNRFHAAAAAVLFTAAPAFAGVYFKQTAPPAEEPVPLNEINLLIDESFQSDFKHGHGYSETQGGNNNTSIFHSEIQLARRVQLTGNWYLKIGADANRYDIGDNRSLAPNTLQSYAAVIALEYWTEGNIGFFVESKPGIYFAHDPSGNAFDSPTNIALAYPLVKDKLYLIGGLTAGRFREYPVLPIGGVLWHINEKWDLRAYLPEPKVVFKASEHIELWGGGEFVGGGFRNDSIEGTSEEVSKEPVEYYELRGGGGVRWLFNKHCSITLAAGYMFQRKFVFYDTDAPDQETDGAPYAKLQANFDF